MISSNNKKELYKYILNNVSRIEESKGCFICVDCPINFSFWNWEDFESHSCIKEKRPFFECIYCGLLVLNNNGERHINMHFQHQCYNLYNCSLCTFSSNSEIKYLKHTKLHSDINTVLKYKCSSCQTEFSSISEFINHIKFYTVVMFNCCVKNCIAKSRSKQQMCEHYRKCHPTKSLNFEITQFLTCSENYPDVSLNTKLMEKFPSLQSLLSIGSCFSYPNDKKPTILLLECLKCEFSTIQWNSFINHCFRCTAPDDSLIHREVSIHFCSFCSTLGTKKHLIEEHIYECDRNATILSENFSIQFPSDKSDSIVNKEEITRPSKRSRSLNSSTNDTYNSKRPRFSESPDSKCKTEEAVISDCENLEINTEFVSIPFDEDGFRLNNPNIPYQQKESIILKMRQFNQNQINIVGKENYGRIPECPECHKVFSYGFGDFKRHFLSVHLDIEKEFIKECLKYTRLPKSNDKFQELQEQIVMRNLRPKSIDKDKIKVPLPYSIVALRQLTKFLPQSTQQYLSEKMRAYSTMSIIIQNFDNSRRFLCNQCTYSSPYALADVRKHIMGSHCGISTKHFRFCLQASRLDPNEFTLLSDDKILNLAEDLSRRTKHKSFGLSSHNRRSQRHALAKKKKVACTLPNVKEPLTTTVAVTTKPVVKMENVQPTPVIAAATTTSSSITTTPTTTNCHSLGGRKGVNALYLNADTNFTLSLPFSKNVLQTLLQQMIPEDQIPSLIQKMKVYSGYSLKRLCKNDRTVAFQCPCGRVFHTARIPDLKMRAATLADARRHVMGVHAKIPQSLITVCCQASRICRENDFQIYSDDMLLQLASERQGKLQDSQSRSNVVADSSSKSQDLQADQTGTSSVDLDEENSGINDHNLSSPMASVCENSGPDNCVSKTNSFLTTNFPEEEFPPSIKDETSAPSFNFVSDLKAEQRQYSAIVDESAVSRLTNESSKIERIIHLPYSLEALKCLTDGYCEPTFFPVLQEKMNIYSKYKIFIVRREGRRIFCCSGCPSSSPHGMGDVKKHILGVHARIPERFKAAAMHCSRLSREDTSLLPDHLLLQLAKMKWKGSVIKPLAELSVEDRIKTFSKKNWEGKQRNTRSSSYYSMVEQSIFSLNQSALQQLSVDSLKNSSNNGNGNNNNNSTTSSSTITTTTATLSSTTTATTTTNLKPENVIINDDTIDDNFMANRESEIIVPDEFFVEIRQKQSEVAYKCSICDYESRFVGNTKGHIVREHLGIPAHTCSICEQLFNSRASVLTHHEKDHANVTFTLAHYGPYKIAMSRIVVKDLSLFSSLSSSSSATQAVFTNLNKEMMMMGKSSQNHPKHNSFLQSNQELNDFDMYLI